MLDYETFRWVFEIGLKHYLVVANLLFAMGIFVMITKRNAIAILIGVEMVLNGASINFVAFNRFNGLGEKLLDGQIVSLFIIVLAAAEAALAVAICMNFYKNLNTIDVDRGDTLAG